MEQQTTQAGLVAKPVPNRWGGVDLHGARGFARRTKDDGQIDVMCFNKVGVLLWQATFDLSVPSEIVEDAFTRAWQQIA